MNEIEEFVQEGEANIKKYNTTFYNPAQKTNRDISVAVIKEYFKEKESFKVLDAMSATGLRGIRYLKEISNCKVFFNDLNEKAISCIKENLMRNGLDVSDTIEENLINLKKLTNKVNVIKSDCNLLMCTLTGFFDVIDIDPFGGCSIYIDNAFRAIKHNGLLCFTCTDKGVLCSNESKCWVKYSTTILKGFSKHETPLRVLLSLISRQASKFGYSIEPLVSLSLDFYVRVFVKVTKNKPKSSILNNSMFYLCKCSNFINLKENKSSTNVCVICNNKMKLCGPFWCGPLHNKEFVSKLLNHKLDNRSTVILNYLANEIDSPFYYEMTTLCSRTKLPCVKLKEILYALQNSSFESSLTHCEISGFKTTAPVEFIDGLIKLKMEDKDNSLFERNEIIDKRMSLDLKKGVLISHLGPLALPDLE